MEAPDSTSSQYSAQQELSLVTVGRVEDVPIGRSASVELLDGRQLALFNIGGEFFAIDNFCPHHGAPLADGNLCGHIVECNWHGWRFNVKSGACLIGAADVKKYDVVIEDGNLKIWI